MFFHLVDTIGFSNFDFNEFAEFKNILNGKIQPGDAIAHPSDRQIYLQKLTRFPLFEKRVHGVIIVVKANDPRLMENLKNTCSQLEIYFKIEVISYQFFQPRFFHLVY